ncbi:MAG: histidine kinase [Nibricoccus sp.]
MRATLFPPADEKTHPWRKRWFGGARYWLFQAGGWGLFWLVLTLGSLTSGSVESTVRHEIVAQTLLTLSLLICSHLLRVLVLGLRGNSVSLWRFLPGLGISTIAAAAAACGPWVFWSAGFAGMGEEPPDSMVFPYIVFLFGVALLLGVWLCLYFGYHYFHRYQQGVVERLQLDAAIKDAELRALRAQINPHFLFNSLNTLRALIPRNLDRPREAITLLADLLRASLTVGQQRTITLAQEMETVKSYLALEQLRFEERLRVRIHIAPEACTFLLPPFVLQTLVENALKFGVAPFESGGDVAISAEICEDKLLLVVTNRGALNAASSSTGLGLKNARSRLQLLCGNDATITLSQEGPLVIARLSIPAKTSITASLHP